MHTLENAKILVYQKNVLECRENNSYIIMQI